jgi:hypothetical protein
MKREGLLAWLLVAAALAMPSGSLYFWLSTTVDASRSHEQTIHRQRETPIFVAPRLRQRLVNPEARSPEVRDHEDEKPVAAPAQASAPAPTPAVVVQAPKPAAPAVEAPKPAPVVEIASADWATKRDPMLSPHEAEILSRPIPSIDVPDAEPAPAPKRVVRRGKPIQETVDLEAIIAMEGVPSAIVNGVAVKIGDMVGKVKVVMITAERVTFAYHNLRFVKSI